MNWDELTDTLQLNDIRVTIIKPLRISANHEYETGMMIGFKSGIFGGGWKRRSRDGHWHEGSFSSLKMHWIKKPKVQVAYNSFTWGKSQHSDWVEVDNCTFEIIKKEETNNGM